MCCTGAGGSREGVRLRKCEVLLEIRTPRCARAKEIGTEACVQDGQESLWVPVAVQVCIVACKLHNPVLLSSWPCWVLKQYL